MADSSTLDDLLKRVSRNSLMAECSDEHLIKIAKWLNHWRDISADLGLTEAEEEEIQSRDGYLNRKKLDMLRKWKSKYVTKANYLKLADVFHEHSRNDLVHRLCDLIPSVEDDAHSEVIKKEAAWGSDINPLACRDMMDQSHSGSSSLLKHVVCKDSCHLPEAVSMVKPPQAHKWTQEKQEQLKQRDQNYAALMKADDTPLNTNAEDFDCMICIIPVQAGEGVILRGCLHVFCKNCLRDCINHSQEAEVKCPYKDDELACGSVIEEREIRALLTPQELHDRIAAKNGAGDHSFHCRTPNCKGFCFYDDDVNEFNCQVCNKKNCILCKAIHDEMNCQEYQDDLKRRAVNDAAAKATQDMLEGMIKNDDAMNCPSCKIVVMKKDGCDWIRCSMCKTEICWATKGPRWGPKGNGDSTAGCMCRVGGKKCSPMCRNCH